MRTEFGDLTVTYTARGLRRYQMEVEHEGLHRFQVVRADDKYFVQQKADALAAQWDAAWTRVDKRNKIEAMQNCGSEEAERRTSVAQDALRRLDGILSDSLAVSHVVDWESLKDRDSFQQPRPKKMPNPPPPSILFSTPAPNESIFPYSPRLNILDRLFRERALRKINEARALFEEDCERWEQNRVLAEAEYAEAMRQYQQRLNDVENAFLRQVAEWEAAKAEYYSRQEANNAILDEIRERYMAGDPGAIRDMCDIVLEYSEYPDSFPHCWNLDYLADARILVVDYQLPAPDDLPSLAVVKYVKSRNALDEKYLSDAERNRNYDGVLYKIVLRSIHELFEADIANVIDSIAFNGIVESVEPGTGHQVRPCILTIVVRRQEFLEFNLEAVEPKACFKTLKGVGSSKLHSLAAVAPIVRLNTEDSRFIPGYAVADAIVEGDNLAAMDWEDFEHLIRELFEREFKKAGGEVKVTRASRDGGVDAIIFDPDPIRGGKLIVQAKRYTNTVGVAAVRDLYGSVMNEGANKGILVTTADYGPDAYEFANGKPLTLLSGSNLLHMLQQHGVKARIDIGEARQILGLDKKSN